MQVAWCRSNYNYYSLKNKNKTLHKQASQGIPNIIPVLQIQAKETCKIRIAHEKSAASSS
jgi:hypothetical protein